MEMSVEEETVTSGGSQASTTPSLQLTECTGSYNNISIMAEVTPATTDGGANVAATCSVPAAVPPPNHGSLTDTRAHSEPENAGQKTRGNENNIGRRNSLHHSKQQQQQKLTKRRNTSTTGFKHPTSGKRRRRANSESDSVLPTNFLMGGNIFDPLNLNSLLDEEVNRALNAETPKSSPLPTKSRDPVEILIPRDITDPLNLNSGITGSNFLISPFKSGGRRRHRNRHYGGGGVSYGGGGGGGGGISAPQLDLSESAKGELKTSASALLPGMSASCSALEDPRGSSALSSVSGDSHECQEGNSTTCKEEMTSVSAVSASHTQTRSLEDSSSFISGGSSQHSGRRKRRRNSGKTETTVTHSTPIAKPGSGERTCGTGGSRNSQSFHTPRSGPRAGPGGRPQQAYNQQKDQRKKFQYGNYNKYYGYRNPGASEDPRVCVLRPEWFRGKDVLDLGCNSGHLTLYIAKMLRPAHILGMDIDSGLVHAARKNIRHYLSELETREARRRAAQEEQSTKREERRGNERHTGTEEKHNEAETRDKNGKPLKGESSPAEAVNDNVSCHTDEPGTQGQHEAGTQGQHEAGTQGQHEAGTQGRHEPGTQGRHEPGTQGRHEPGTQGRHEAGTQGRHEAGTQGRHEAGTQGRHEAGTQGRHEAGTQGRHEAGTQGRHEAGTQGQHEAGTQGQHRKTEQVDCDLPPADHPVSCSFPVSLRISRGPIAAPPLTETSTLRPGEFPSNVSFMKANYVLENDSLLLTQRPEYDIILCLSVTKWVHLNWGDTGLKRLFKRVYRHLRPGGRFILEPQPWESYARRKKLTENISRNYQSICLKPDQFSTYLTNEVGFSSYEFIGTPNSSFRGFQRPIYVFHK